MSRTESIGKLVVDYVPYRRGQLLLEFLGLASGAALVWWFIVWLERSLLMPLLGIAAVTLSGLALSWFFRLLSPGKRVAVHERGIVLGRNTIPWERIEKVSYEKQLPTRHDPNDYETHNLRFQLAGNADEVLSLRDDELPSHVNVSELLTHLIEHVAEVDFLDAPKTRVEEIRSDPVKRDPDLAKRLWADADAAIEEASKEGVSARAVAALRQGELLRAGLARRYWWSSLQDGFVSGSMIVVAIIAALAGFYTALGLLFQLVADLGWGEFGLFELLPVPQGVLLYPVVGAAVAASWWLVARGEEVARRKRKSARQQSALSKVLRAGAEESQTDAFLARVEAHDPFVVYLRSFSGEHLQYLETPLLGGSEYALPVEYEIMERDFDVALTECADDAIPVLALANAADASVSREMHILAVPDADWFLVACELIHEAKLVLVHLGAASESLLIELRLLDRSSFQDKTLVILGKDLDAEVLDDADNALLARFPHQISEGAPDWQRALGEFLSA